MKNTIVWLMLGLGLLLAYPLVSNWFTGDTKVQPLGINDSTAPPEGERLAESTCVLAGSRFTATFSTHGASLRKLELTDPKYQINGAPANLVTTTHPSRMPLRTDIRFVGEGSQQVAYNDLDFTLTERSPTSCTFVHTSAANAARIIKKIGLTSAPFELAVDVEITNTSPERREHRFTIEQTSWRTHAETQASLGRISPLESRVVVSAGGKVTRQMTTDFEPADFKPDNGFTDEQWHRAPGSAAWTAVETVYYASALVPKAPEGAFGETQIEEIFDARLYQDKTKDPAYGHVYRARLSYERKALEAGQSAQYKSVAYMGPKERGVLASAVGGAGLEEAIDLGMFAVIGKVLVGYVVWLRTHVGAWGWAICLLTVTVRLLLTPLTLPQIKSGMAMRRLKPEMDELNAKYKSDPAQRGLALQELWRKHKVMNPAIGCIPVLLQMPVWFALYQALQTAVELYHEPFGPFIPDLSEPGKYFIIPVVLAASSFAQMKIMPPQGDPAQAKMMTYMMPSIFLVMMLFLPAGLGVYMLTNTWLGIVQQLVIERVYAGGAAGGMIVVKEKKTSSPGPSGTA